jgi:glucose-6-phosphate 1-dehydrogenase
VPAGATLHVSHVAPADLATLAANNPSVRLRARIGTALWHGDKSFLHLTADVAANVIRGQYSEGAILGKPVPAYRAEPNVNNSHICSSHF